MYFFIRNSCKNIFLKNILLYIYLNKIDIFLYIVPLVLKKLKLLRLNKFFDYDALLNALDITFWTSCAVQVLATGGLNESKEGVPELRHGEYTPSIPGERTILDKGTWTYR